VRSRRAAGCHFEYGKTTVTEHEVACEQGASIEEGEQGVGVTIAALAGKTTYHCEVLVKNTHRHAEGSGEFETLTPGKPTIESENTSGVTSTGAALKAQVEVLRGGGALGGGRGASGGGAAVGVGNGCGAAGSQRFYPRFWRPLASARFRHSTTPLAV